MLYLSSDVTAVRAGTSTIRACVCVCVCVCVFFFGFVQQETSIWYVPYDMYRRFCRFWGGTQTNCGRCSVHPKIHHPAKHSLDMCEHTGGVLGDFVLVFHRDISSQDSLIGPRNDLMTEDANSLSADAGPEL